jgi:hypothetical protein
MMQAGAHLTEAGLRDIAEITQLMNRRQRSRFLESSEAIRQPSRSDTETKIWSEPHGDMGTTRTTLCAAGHCPSTRRRVECSWLFAGNTEDPAVLVHVTPSS